MEKTLFIDESYRAPSDGAPPHYYIVASVLVSQESLDEFADFLKATGGLPFHTSEMVKFLGGRLRLLDYLEFLQTSDIECKVFLGEIDPTDRLGEAARFNLLKKAMSDQVSVGDNVTEVVYDRRMPGYQAKADQRSVTTFRNQGVIPRSLMVRSQSAQTEPGLVLADCVAWSYRQHHLGTTSMFWNMLLK